MPCRGLVIPQDEPHLAACLSHGKTCVFRGARPQGTLAREERGFTVSSAHLPVPYVGGQHLVLLILQAEEDTVCQHRGSWHSGRTCLEDAAHQVPLPWPWTCRSCPHRRQLPLPQAGWEQRTHHAENGIDHEVNGHVGGRSPVPHGPCALLVVRQQVVGQPAQGRLSRLWCLAPQMGTCWQREEGRVGGLLGGSSSNRPGVCHKLQDTASCQPSLEVSHQI